MKKFLVMLAAMFMNVSSAFAGGNVVTLNTTNTLSLRSEVSDESVGQIVTALELMKENTVYLYINSPGGSITAGNHLIAVLHDSGKHVVCIADFAASMAFSILQSCDERLIVDGALIMQHQASVEVKGSVSNVRRELALVDKLVAKLNNQDAKRLGMPVKDFQAKIANEWWMFDGEILEVHAADKLTGVKCSRTLTQATVTQEMRSPFGAIILTWSQCPLIYYPLQVQAEKKKGVSQEDFDSWTKSLEPQNQAWKDRSVPAK